MLPILLAVSVFFLPQAAGHASIWHPSMFGFNVTGDTFPYDNRPVAPLADMPFSQWWFHGHLDLPPNPGDIFNLPAGQTVTTEIACNKGATTFFNSSDGGDIRDPNDPNNPCPGSPISEFHTTGIDDVKGCALAVAYKSDVHQVLPTDFAVFSINHTCVWTRFTDFQVPARMPPCPDGGCTCAFFWIHSPDSGSEQNYMNGFKCNVTDPTSTVAIAPAQVPRRCGADPDNGVPNDTPGNCTFGAKQPFYWFNREQNNMFEGPFSPPFYTDLYNFRDGAQNDIFLDSYISIPVPGPNQTELPIPADTSSESANQDPFVPTNTVPDNASSTPSAAASSSPFVQGAGTDSCINTTILPPRAKRRSYSRRSLDQSSSGYSHMARRRRRLSASKRTDLWHVF